jgi:hypothetical protein
MAALWPKPSLSGTWDDWPGSIARLQAQALSRYVPCRAECLAPACWVRARHLSAFSGAISASFRCKHGKPPRQHRINLPKNKTPSEGGTDGVEFAWQDFAGGHDPAKLFPQVGTPVIVP